MTFVDVNDRKAEPACSTGPSRTFGCRGQNWNRARCAIALLHALIGHMSDGVLAETDATRLLS